MISTYSLLESQLVQLVFLENDLQIHSEIIKDDRVYLETEAEIQWENGNTVTAEHYWDELTLLCYPVRKIEAEIRQIKKSILTDYAELILTTTGDISLANSIIKAKKNAVMMDKTIGALKEKFQL